MKPLVHAFVLSLLAAGPALALGGESFVETFERAFSPRWEILGSAQIGPPGHSLQNSLRSSPGETASEIGALYSTMLAGNRGSAEAWFFDDLGGCLDGVGKAQMLLVSGMGVGVDTEYAACHYVARSSAHDYVPTALERTNGWHRLALLWEEATLTIAVDAVPVATMPLESPPASVFLGDNWSPGSAGSALWDDVAVSVVAS